ncbi:MAG: HAMP domain-containing histidine kinase, partial [Lachnospiraceae bacterium]|nr:HAMP domain-containing histidine kinase [Lachnospiraceae bacterium]
GETSVPLILFLTAEGALFSAVLLLGAAFFLRRRERLYEEAEAVVAQYADGRFDVHLPIGETGAVHRFFGKVEQLAMSLQAKSEAEHRAKEFLKDMISNISHQLKTPLAALDMYMEILGEEPENAETVKDFSRKSMRSLERMEQLIQSLLKMARLDTGSIVFEKRQCFVAEIAAQAAGELSERARQEGKKIVMEGGTEEIIFCDEDWTREALENLIKNALDHTEAGGTVRVAWIRSPVLFRLSVEDDGCGIAPEDIHHIFKKFYRSQNSGDRQGVGLGLSLAKSIVEEQGGMLSVESSPGEGSVFRISFPEG